MPSSLSKKRRASFEQISQSITSIRAYVEDMSFQAFEADEKTRSAVERKLQIISEAAIRLGDHATEVCPKIAWADIRGMGNWLRHQYEHIQVETLWQTINQDLSSLEVAVLAALDVAAPMDD